MAGHKFHKALLFLPTVLLLLHSFTPHHHDWVQQQEVRTVVSEHACPKGFLSDIFNVDLGAHHLEEFQVQKNPIAILAVFIWPAAWILRPQLQQLTCFPTPDDQPLHSVWMQTALVLRGPPAQMV